MDAISTILWDVGGVLLTNAWDRTERDAVLARFGLDPGEFERRHEDVFERFERDEISLDEYLRRTVFFEPRRFAQSDFVEAMRAQSRVLAGGALAILRQLAASHEYTLAAVNNESRALNEFRLTNFGLADELDAFFSSCYLGVRKPDRRIYQIALDVLGRDPERVVFIDDRAENVAAAAGLGIHAIRYQGSTQLSDELARLGVRITQNVLD